MPVREPATIFLVSTFFLVSTLIASLAAPVVAAPALLSVVETMRDVPVESPLDLVVSGDDRHLYVLGNSALALYERDVATGLVTYQEAYLQGYDVDGIFAASSMALSPDDRFLYVASPRHQDEDGDESGAIAIFERDAADGSLRLAGVENGGFPEVGERSGSIHITLTADGEMLYAASVGDNAVLWFRRHPADGSLSFLGATSERIDPRSRVLVAALDPDERFLYLAQRRFTDTEYDLGILSVYARDATTGALTFVEEHVNRSGDVDDMDRPIGVTVSPDGAHVYVMSSTRFPYDTDEGAIVAFARDPASGRLTFLGSQDRPPTPADSTWNDDGTRLYVTGVSGGTDEPFSELLVYARDPASGALTPIAAYHEGNSFFLESSPLTVVALAHDRRHLYAGTFDRRLLTAWELDDDGALRLLEDPDDPTGGRGALRGAAEAAISPDGRHLYVATPPAVGLAVYERDPETGRLDFVELVSRDEPAPFPRVAVSGDGRWVYALAGVFARDADTGRLEHVAQPDAGVDLFGIDLVPSPDGRHLYVTGGREGIRAYAQAPGGRLQAVELTDPPPVPGRGELGHARAGAMTSDGAYLLTVGIFTGTPRRGDETAALWAFARDAASGELTFAAHADLGPPEPTWHLALAPDGRHAYLVNEESDELLVLRHDRPARLRLVERHAEGVDGVSGLDEPHDVAVSPSGHLVYVAGRRSDTLAIFRRDPVSGELTFLETLPGAGLVRPQSLVVAPGNRHVYVTSERLAAITVLTLDCVGSERVLCLDGERFRVEVTWRDGSGEGPGRLVPLRSENSGLFWFFGADNWEMLVKVLDGCRQNGRYWVFAAATTDVGYILRVVDTRTGATRLYDNPLGVASPAVTDTGAFDCP